MTLSLTDFPYNRLQVAATFQNRGDLSKAQAIYWEILFEEPNQFDALHLLGVTKCQETKYVEGVWFIRRALDQRPEEPLALNNLGLAMCELHRHDEAIVLFDRSLTIQPHNAQTWFNRANALVKQDRLQEAIESYDRTLSLSPDLPGALANMGAALMAVGDAAAALINLGAAELVRGDASPAIAFLRKAMEHGANRTFCLISIGKLLEELGDRGAARRTYIEAVESAPHLAEPRWALALSNLPNIPEDEAEILKSRADFKDSLDELLTWYATEGSAGVVENVDFATSPFYLAYQRLNNRELMSQFGDLRSLVMSKWFANAGLASVPDRQRDGPLRVGIVSAELYNHSVWQAIMRGWFKHIDRDRASLVAFHVGAKSDAETDFARANSDTFHFGERPLVEWARLIIDSRLDILIYPSVGMNITSSNLAALRLAPIQMATWGHPDTTGLPTIDYYVSAEAFEPHDAERAYREKLIRLPGIGVCYSPPPVVPVSPELHELGLDDGRTLILCPGAPFKYAPQDDAILSAIAQRAQNTQFVFFHSKNKSLMSNRLEARIRSVFASEGLDAERQVRFIPFQGRQTFLGLIDRADLCLDTIGFSGFNTAMQILGVGTPLVAYEGDFVRGRLASGPIRLLGLHELVATTADAFVSIAARLATDKAYRSNIRNQIRQGITTLYEDRETVSAFQRYLERLWLRKPSDTVFS